MTFVHLFSGISLNMEQVLLETIDAVYLQFTTYKIWTHYSLINCLSVSLSLFCVQWIVLRDHIEEIDNAVKEKS